jgi:nitrite reductase/ring-hydroxylating ferredoxin subunit
VTDEPLSELGNALPMAPPAPSGGIDLPIVHAGAALPEAGSRPPRWVAIAESVRPGAGTVRTLKVDDVSLLFAEIGGSLLAYQNECASCGESLGAGQLEGGMLRCPSCEVEFDLPRAGRAAGSEPLQLKPVPLLEGGGLRVAV